MKVGILTFHHTTNFGATLQAYALSKFIQQQGCSVEFINYQPEKAVKVYREVLYFKAKKTELLSNFIRSYKMQKFVKQNMTVSKKIYSTPDSLKGFEHRYDVLVVGSDEIWNINSFRGTDTSYFLDFVGSDVKKISYAASFGSTTDLGYYEGRISSLVGKFDQLAVRDTNSLKLIEQACGRGATKVLDPTFLTEYEDLVGDTERIGKHILIYGKVSSDLGLLIRKTANKLNVPVISVGYTNKFADASHLAVGPKEWLQYFATASYVFTSFYHGTIFSILFQKPFTVFSSEHKTIKLKDLLNDLELSHRIDYDPSNDQANCETIDYDSVFRTIEDKREISKKYILESLGCGSY